MASSYTANNGIEKIGTGEQAGTWGATTNTNFDILDRAINGVGAITLSGTTHTLTTTDGALSDGHFKVLVFGGTLSSTNTVTISPNDQDKLYFVFNNTSGSQSIIIKQGSGATVTVGNGKTAIVYADGAGSGAAVAQIETGSDEFTEDVTMKTGDGALLTLQTSDTTVVDGDVLGALQFQAPNESSGTDGELTEDKWWKVIQYNHKDQTLSPSEISGGAVKYCAKSSVIIFETSAVALSASSLEL